MKFYIVNFYTYNNNELINIGRPGYSLIEETIKDKKYHINWKNLDEIYQEIGGLCGFNIFNFKKGRRVSFFNSKIFDKKSRDVKEWKYDLNIDFIISYREIESPTMEMLNKMDAIKVKKYLDERS